MKHISKRKNFSFLRPLVWSILFVCAITGFSLAQTSYTFTPCGATGSLGPTQTQVSQTYTNTNLNNLVTSLSGIQHFTVPTAGLYRVKALGAQGGGANGGYGALMEGDFTFSANEVIRIVVGQQGITQSGEPNACAGSGGSYVVRSSGNTTTDIVVIAGGGGGSPGTYSISRHASTLTTGNWGAGASNTDGAPGANGNGGNKSVSANTQDRAAGGGGFFTDGQSIQQTGFLGAAQGGTSFINGSYGGSNNTTGAPGGFGGGGAVWTTGHKGGGGGGGFSGGGGGQTSSLNAPTHCGGGGGSFNNGVNQNNVVSTSTGDGIVVITELCALKIMSSTSGTVNPASLCSGNSITITTDAVSNYSWSTGATTSSIVVSPTTNTVISVSGTSSMNCTATRVLSITVAPSLPVLSISNPSANVCVGSTVALTASGANTYTWTNAGVVNGQSFTPSGTIVYTVTGENACGTSVSQTTVTVQPPPTINAVVSSPSVCSGQTVSFSAVGNGTNVWSNGYINGTTFSPQINTSYTVVATSAIGCTAQAVAFVSVVTTPVAPAVSNPTLICIGSSAILSAPGASSYTWTTPSGTLGTNQITVSPGATTTYTVAKSNANCTDVRTVTLIVNGLPTLQVVAIPPVVCEGKPTVLTGGGASNFTWTAPGFTTTGASPTVSPINSTTYMVTGSDGTCVSTSSVQVLTNPNPVINIVPSFTAICYGDSVNLSANGALGYTWTSSSGTLSSYPSGTAITTTNGFFDKPTLITLYTATGVNQHTCYTSATQVIIVNPNPTLTIQSTKTLVCTNSVSTLTVSGADTYTWDVVNAGGATTSVNPVAPVVTTIYSVTGFYSTQCHSTKTVQVRVYEPTLTVNSPTSTCQGGTITLNASVNGPVSYSWHVSPAQNYSSIQVSPTTPTFYLVTAVSVSNNVNCPVTKTVDVTIYANPTITAVTDRTLICKGEPAYLTGGGGVTYNWQPVAGSGGTVSVMPNGHTTYTAFAIDQNGCKGTATVQVKVQSCVGIEEQTTKLAGFNLYPNPAHQTISLSAPVDITLTLTNELGQTIRTIQLEGNVSQQVDISDLSTGIYFITGKKEGSVVKEKLIIAR